jgi:hypothetical protein
MTASTFGAETSVLDRKTGLLAGGRRNATVTTSEDRADPTMVWVTDQEGRQQLLESRGSAW